MKPPLTAQQQFVKDNTPKCEDTGLCIPECSCYACMYELIRRNMPNAREDR